jgi:asparagine synthase (glutamine-hydrolysing)
MCGIAGILELAPGKAPAPEALARMAAVLRHRGPDAQGVHRTGPVGLGHRRLSIIDLVSGQQPMTSPDGRVWLAFNGEIYNYPELKAELTAKGHRFRTRSDTEVLLTLYLEEGLEAFARLSGMFAVALWDGRTGTLVLARDRFGKKPLFYYQDGARFLFASEMKALLASGSVAPRVSVPALHEYLSYGYTVGEEAIVDGVRRLPPAHLLVLQGGRATVRPYWSLRFEPSAAEPPQAEVLERLDELLPAAVRRRLLSDVPLGAFLSGGLDSSVVVALMARMSDRPVRTFTVGFDDADYSELADARVVARHLGTDHHEMIVRPDALGIMPDLVWYLDEPFADSSAVPTFYVCRAARAHVTVALSGDGGDEVFAGYTRYLKLDRHRRLARIPGWARRAVARPLARALPFTLPGWNSLYAAGALRDETIPYGLGIFPYVRERLYSADFAAAVRGLDPYRPTTRLLEGTDHLDPVSRYQYFDTLEYLPADILTKVDRMSMGNSLEVRSPFLDHALVEYMAGIPASLKVADGVGKAILRRYAERLLPAPVLAKRKQGFAIPKGRWFKGELRDAARDVLLDPRTLARGYFEPAAVRRMLDHHASGARDYGDWIWSLLVLETWLRRFVDEPVVRDAETAHPTEGAAAVRAAGA